MTNLIVELAKYIFIVLICFYTYQSFNVFRTHDIRKQNKIFLNQNYLMFLMHLMGYLVIYIKTDDLKVWVFYGAQVVLLAGMLLFYALVYKRSSRLLTNNVCMLLTISFIILTRIDFDSSVRQFRIVVASAVISAVIPALIRRVRVFRSMEWLYAGVGVAALGIVALFGFTSYGANLSFTIAGVTVQPSEFVKLLFVFFVASRFQKSKELKDVLITSAVAALHVIILVLSRDLGMALIFFVVYMSMLYAGTKNKPLTAAGLLGGGVASVAAYHLFSHVRVRVQVWKDPFGNYDNGGYQVAQSLFAIGTGGWFGMGLFQGSPSKIPVVKKDFIFSAIVEEMGGIFGICLILICLSCFVMFVNISIQLKDEFYQLVALGLGVSYAFQVFLTIGGGIKFIPLTGVTLPLISMGGSSMLSTLMMFAVIQGMYILREDEGEEVEREPKQQKASGRKKRTAAGGTGNSGSGKRRREEKAAGPKRHPAQEQRQERR